MANEAVYTYGGAQEPVTIVEAHTNGYTDIKTQAGDIKTVHNMYVVQTREQYNANIS